MYKTSQFWKTTNQKIPEKTEQSLQFVTRSSVQVGLKCGKTITFRSVTVQLTNKWDKTELEKGQLQKQQ